MSRLNTIEGVLLDLEGVLFVGNQPVEGAVDMVNYLQATRIPYRFMTNTTTTSRDQIAQKMCAMGFNVVSDQILTAPAAAVHYLQQKRDISCYLLVAEDVKPEFSAFRQSDQHPDVVVIGDIGPVWDYALINRLFQMLMSGAELIALHKSKYWQTPQGLQVDIGAFVAGLEYVTGKPSVVIGKPSSAFFAAGIDALGCAKEKIVMIGDDIDSDVGGAQQAGILGALVRTGKFREETCIASAVTPDWIWDSVAELSTLIK